MLITKYFSFDKKGRLTLFVERISTASLLRILRMCVEYARRKHTAKPRVWAMVPTLEDVV